MNHCKMKCIFMNFEALRRISPKVPTLKNPASSWEIVLTVVGKTGSVTKAIIEPV